jgi:AraC-like DNA-binding protein
MAKGLTGLLQSPLQQQVRGNSSCSSNLEYAQQRTPANMAEIKNRLRILVLPTSGIKVTLSALAQDLGVTSRTLQRRLREHGSTFRASLDAVRSELAIAQLEARAKVTDAADATGFSEPSCFSRAFKRWTGRAPSRFVSDDRRSDTSSSRTR